MKRKQQVDVCHADRPMPSLACKITSPENLSASVLTICHGIDHSQIEEMATELRRQTAAVHKDDLSRAESMLVAQAHTLDGIFTKLASRGLTASRLEVMESYLRLAFKAQNQARTTLQTLAELKAPKQVAFVRQANIGNQVQVNNGTVPARTRKNRNAPNELLEVTHGERLDARATGSASGVDSAMATLEKQHRPDQR